MSSAGDNLETLTDRELREKCLFYGLQNVPITDTTRKLVINKLRTCLSNDKVKNKALKNRTSILKSSSSHKTNIDPEKKKEKFTLKNRHTIAAKIVPTDVLQQLREQGSPPPLKRRSERKHLNAFQSGRKSDSETYFPPEKEPLNIIDDLVNIEDKKSPSPSPTFAAATLQPTSSIPVLSTNQVRKSRSPSLSKSIVVTTSYGKEQKPLSTPIKEIVQHIENDDFFDDLEEKDFYEKPPPNVITTLHNPNVSYLKEEDPFPVGYKPIYPNININSGKKTSAPDICRRVNAVGIPVKQTKSFALQLSRPHYFESDEDENIEAPFLSDFAKRLARLKAEPIDLGFDDRKESYKAYKNKNKEKAKNYPVKEKEKKDQKHEPYYKSTPAVEAEADFKDTPVVLRKREIFVFFLLICLSLLLITYYYPIKI